MVYEIIVAFLGPLHLTRHTLSKPITPIGEGTPVDPTAFPSGGGCSATLGLAPGVPLDLAIGIPLGDGLALVVLPLAPGQAQFDLDPAFLEVQGQWNQRDALLPQLARQPADLHPVQQELAGPARRVVGPGALGVLGDVHAPQPDLVVADGRVPVDQGGPT